MSTLLYVVPQANRNTDGSTVNAYPYATLAGATGMRYHQLYSKTMFSTSGTITAMAHRLDGSTSGSGVANYNLKINLAYTAVSWNSPSSTFANNIGTNLTTVLDNSSINISSDADGSNPNAFNFAITFTSSFFYDPALGDLLVEILMRSPPSGPTLDADSNNSNTFKRVTSDPTTGSSGSTTGIVDSVESGLVTQFTMVVGENFNATPIRVAVGSGAYLLTANSRRGLKLRA